MPSLPPRPDLAAALLAGGQSRRMGRDKAALMLDGEPLWRRQLAKLEALEPAELFISGSMTGPFAEAGFEIVTDAVPHLGPLGGLEAILRRAHSEWVVVLAVDLPDAPGSLLAELWQEAQRRGCGVVPQKADLFEPLVAIYPRAALRLVEEMLRGTDRSLQRLVEGLIARRLAASWPIPATAQPFFRNVNSPADL